MYEQKFNSVVTKSWWINIDIERAKKRKDGLPFHLYAGNAPCIGRYSDPKVSIKLDEVSFQIIRRRNLRYDRSTIACKITKVRASFCCLLIAACLLYPYCKLQQQHNSEIYRDTCFFNWHIGTRFLSKPPSAILCSRVWSQTAHAPPHADTKMDSLRFPSENLMFRRIRRNKLRKNMWSISKLYFGRKNVL